MNIYGVLQDFHNNFYLTYIMPKRFSELYNMGVNFKFKGREINKLDV